MIEGLISVQKGQDKSSTKPFSETVELSQLVAVLGQVGSSSLNQNRVTLELELDGICIRCVYDSQLSKRKLNPKQIDDFADSAMDNGRLLFVKGYFVERYRLLNICGVQEVNNNVLGNAYPTRKSIPPGTAISELHELLNYPVLTSKNI